MKKDFTIKSLSRDGVGYKWQSDYNDHENGYFRSPGRCIAPEVNEFQTFNDGMNQHSPLWAVSSDNIQDFIVSLLLFLKDNLDYLETVSDRWPRNEVSADRIKFYEGLKYNSESYRQALYNDDAMKKSNAESKRYDKRWQEIPRFADGSCISVFRFFIKSHFSAIDRYFIYQIIRRIMNYPWADNKELENLIGFDPSTNGNKHIRQAFDALNDMVNGYRNTRDGLNQLDCLERNMGLDDKDKQKE